MQSKYQGVPLEGQGLTARPEQAGATGVKAWLKSLKLHKYWPTVSNWTYQEMMSLNGENIQRQLAEVGSTGMTMGAGHKLVRCIGELRERRDILAVLADCIRKGEVSLANGTYILEAILKSPLPTDPNDLLLWDIVDTFIKVLQLFEESVPRINIGLKGRFIYLEKLINQTPVLSRIFEARKREIINMREANWSVAEQSSVWNATLPVGSESRPAATSTPYTRSSGQNLFDSGLVQKPAVLDTHLTYENNGSGAEQSSVWNATLPVGSESRPAVTSTPVTKASGQNLFESGLVQQRAELDTHLTYENNGVTKDSGFVEDSTVSRDAELKGWIERCLLRELLADEDSPSAEFKSYDESCSPVRSIPVKSFPNLPTQAQYPEPERTQFDNPCTQPTVLSESSYSPQILLLALKSYDQGTLRNIQDMDKFINVLLALNSAVGEQPYFRSPYFNLMIKSAFDLLNHHLKYRHQYNLRRRQALPINQSFIPAAF